MRPSKVKHQEKKLREHIKRAIVAGDKQAEYRAKKAYLNSHHAKAVAAEQANRESKRKYLGGVEHLAGSLNMSAPCEELVWVTSSLQNTRSDGTARFVFNFGPEHQARQIMIKNAIYHPSQLSDDQTLTRGGAPEAIRRIMAAYAEGYHFVSELDIRKAYPSFDSRRAGSLLQLSESVTENNLTLENTRVVPSNTCIKEQLYHDETFACSPEELFSIRYGEDFSYAQQGLLEGSKVSPFIVEMLLTAVCQTIRASGLGEVVNYADNFLLMARSRDDLSALESILREELRTHPVGALEVRDCIYDYFPGRSFEFLGYRLDSQGDQLVASLGAKTDKKLKELRRILYKELHSKMPFRQKEKRLREVEKTHRQTLRAMPAFEDRMAYHDEKMSPLLSKLEALKAQRVPRRRTRSSRIPS